MNILKNICTLCVVVFRASMISNKTCCCCCYFSVSQFWAGCKRAGRWADDAYSERSFLNGHPDLSAAQLENFCEYKKKNWWVSQQCCSELLPVQPTYLLALPKNHLSILSAASTTSAQSEWWNISKLGASVISMYVYVGKYVHKLTCVGCVSTFPIKVPVLPNRCEFLNWIHIKAQILNNKNIRKCLIHKKASGRS